MTVQELIALLMDKPQTARVVLEGCDCCGEAIGVSLTDDGTLILRREDGTYRYDGLPMEAARNQ